MNRRAPTIVRAEIRNRIELAKQQTDLVDLIGKRVKLKARGHEYKGLCPFHNEKSPSFTVRPDKGFFKCFGCGAFGSAIDWVIAFEKCTPREAAEFLLGGREISQAEIDKVDTQRARQRAEEAKEKDDKVARAWRRWERAQVIRPGDPVWRYLQGRGCLTSPVPEVLRFEPAMFHRDYWGSDGKPSKLWLAMLARIDGKGAQFIGLHSTYLVDAGEGRVVQDPTLKAAGVSKLTFGDPLGGAIRLFDSSGDLDVGEGIEDSLSIFRLGGERRPVWAMPAHGFMAGFEIPPWISSLGIYAHHDKAQLGQTVEGRRQLYAPEGVGMHSARKLQDKAREQQIDARVYWPSDNANDFNDVLRNRLAARRHVRAGSVEAAVAP